jgi:hypothetical protein
LNTGLHAYKAGTLLLEPHLQHPQAHFLIGLLVVVELKGTLYIMDINFLSDM